MAANIVHGGKYDPPKGETGGENDLYVADFQRPFACRQGTVALLWPSALSCVIRCVLFNRLKHRYI